MMSRHFAFTTLLTASAFILSAASEASEEDIKRMAACLAAKIVVRIQEKATAGQSREVGTRCGGAGIDGRGDRESPTYSFEPPTQYLFRAPVTWVSTGQQDGGADNITLDPNGRMLSVRVWCKSEDTVFGAGAWSYGYLKYSLEYYTNIHERRGFAEKCFNEILR